MARTPRATIKTVKKFIARQAKIVGDQQPAVQAAHCRRLAESSNG
jgi:hypothetical protein